jgi:hypothetical protein
MVYSARTKNEDADHAPLDAVAAAAVARRLPQLQQQQSAAAGEFDGRIATRFYRGLRRRHPTALLIMERRPAGRRWPRLGA